MIALVAIVGVALVGLFGYYYFSAKNSPPKKSPWSPWTEIPAARPLEMDHKKRDAILKQGFMVDKIPQDLDAIIVGSGIGGLSTGALLSKAGWKVLILEQHDQAGGCCHSYVDKGFEFDVVLGEGENRRTYPVVGDKEAARANLLKYFPKEKEAIDKYIAKIEDCRKESLMAGLPKMLPMVIANLLIRTGLLHWITKYFRYSQQSLQDVVFELTENEDLRAVMMYCFGDYGSLPKDAPWAMQAALVSHFWSGAAYPVGGASQIAHSIIPVLVRAPVTSIVVENGKACGVIVKKGDREIRINAPKIISNAGVVNTFTKFLPKPLADKSRYTQYIHKIGPGHAGIQLFVGLDGTAKELELGPARNYWAFKRPDFDGLFREHLARTADEAADDPCPVLFVSFPSTKDPSWEQKYPGKSVCVVVSFTKWEWFSQWDGTTHKRRGDDYEWYKQRTMDGMWNRVLDYFPQLEGKNEFMDFGSPLAQNYYIGSSKGEIYGLDHGRSRFTPEAIRDLRATTDIDGLYLTGQDVMGAGFAGGAYGGLMCASDLLGRNLFLDLVTLKKEKAAHLKSV